MSVYAAGTSVPVERSKNEIEASLRRYNATGFGYYAEGNKAVIAFKVLTKEGSLRGVKMVLELPERADFVKTKQGRDRTERAQDDEYQKAVRQRWRALCLVVKAKLEAVESGIATFENEWLAYLVMPNGKTVGETVIPAIEIAYSTGKTPPLLGLDPQ